MIKLYSPDSRANFEGFIGVIEPSICKVTEELNGEYELYMEISVTALYFSQIEMRSIIKCKTDPHSTPEQIFRVYRITKPLKGIVGVYARHIIYDLKGIVVKPFIATNMSDALENLSTQAMCEMPFVFSTTNTSNAAFSVVTPTSIWDLMGGKEGSLLDVYGGEYSFDGYSVVLNKQRGSDRGVTIEYGKNLTSLEQDENCAECYTGVVAYWHDINTGATIYSDVVRVGIYDYEKIKVLDLTQDFEEAPSELQLTDAAESYALKNKIGIPTVSLEVSFVPLSKTSEYRNIQGLEEIYLGDIVSVKFPKMKVYAKAQVIKTEYDAIKDRYITVCIGNAKRTIADTLAEAFVDPSSIPLDKSGTVNLPSGEWSYIRRTDGLIELYGDITLTFPTASTALTGTTVYRSLVSIDMSRMLTKIIGGEAPYQLSGLLTHFCRNGTNFSTAEIIIISSAPITGFAATVPIHIIGEGGA